jgi:mannose-6-phosphate isomerase-like protein (cupin superfamily)
MSSQQLLTRYIAEVGDPASLELDPWELPTGEWGVTVTGENVEYAGKFLYLSVDKRIAVGIERLGPSRLVGTHIGETLYFVQGSVLCHPEGDEAYRLKAGDFCYFPPGVDDVWEIEETYVKLFVIHSPDPLPF